MFEQVKTVFRSFRFPTVAERELAYLNEAVSRYDLEMRERAIDAGLFRRR
ncbi:DUF3563 domain-containing protein [Gemmobacter aquarius]|uniref:DUF3563 domain-containing protein n=1 Tax=Paragemmobacter aquarius TaxID=2169400 RepID=A0A2S0UJC5_9RHOB|nr:DUF3563 family protein [Gemmobacter aquarius]AWB47871.1 DUF3563 domain-containing protein [Gemmobacter aquarius]